MADLDAAILGLLCRATTSWAPLAIAKLTATEEEALLLLTAAGMLERRLAVRMRLAGAKETIEVVMVVTGERGLVQALEGVIAEAWVLWGEIYKSQLAAKDGPRPALLCERTKDEEFRLTEPGAIAQRDANGPDFDRRGVLDFVKKTGLYGPQSPAIKDRPDQFIPGVGRLPVPGSGRAEHVEIKTSGPQQVHVTNLGDVVAPLGGIERVLQALLEKMAAAGLPSGPKGEAVSQAEDGPQRQVSERAGPPPKRIADNDAEKLVAKYLKTHGPNTSIRKINAATGLPLARIQKMEAWRQAVLLRKGTEDRPPSSPLNVLSAGERDRYRAAVMRRLETGESPAKVIEWLQDELPQVVWDMGLLEQLAPQASSTPPGIR